MVVSMKVGRGDLHAFPNRGYQTSPNGELAEDDSRREKHLLFLVVWTVVSCLLMRVANG